MRRSQVGPILLCCFVITTVYFLRGHHESYQPVNPSSSPIVEQNLPPSTESSHPIRQLITKADQDQAALLSAQSDTLAGAVAQYKKRYGLSPPPNFDKWYEFAKTRDVKLIDEYDTIYHSLLPFWGVAPAVIRQRAREALGFDNSLLGVYVRSGTVVTAAGGTEWQQQSTVGMMKEFVQFLPDMDLAFNVHDEPRVVVPFDDLSRLVQTGKDDIATVSKTPKNVFSTAVEGLSDGKRPYEVKTTRFNRYAHQATWTESRMSCSPDSPARVLDDSIQDSTSQYTFSSLNFIANKTAFSDICLYSSLKERYGFFDRPNAFNIVHDLFPIFSQSKISSFQDILYPSPWYWSDKVPYRAEDDRKWEQKKEVLYWRGSTTGGFSRDGGWRRQHRQKFVEKINALDNTKIYARDNSSVSGESWTVQDVSRQDYKNLMDVHFAHVGQCDPGDCQAQKEYFEIVKPDKQHDAWAYKYLLDIDGNAFSGRFYAFLKSTSLVYKMAIFREWHEEWIKPWLHYVPLGLDGDEYVESVRYFQDEQEGRAQAARLASQGREWAKSVLRKVDYEAWLFRLLLEYARVVDDDRNSIGFSA